MQQQATKPRHASGQDSKSDLHLGGDDELIIGRSSINISGDIRRTAASADTSDLEDDGSHHTQGHAID